MSSRAYVFDLNGTLVPIPPREVSEASLDECARLLDIDARVFRAWWRETFDERNLGTWGAASTAYLDGLLSRHGVHRSPNVVERAAAARRDFTRATVQLTDDARRCLVRLRQAGNLVGIITGCGPSLPEVWPELDVACLVDHVQFSVTAGIIKPDRRCYQAMASELGVSTSRCVFIGDGAGNELAGARAAGCTPVKLRRDGSARFEWSDAAWDGITVKSLDEIPEIVGSSGA